LQRALFYQTGIFLTPVATKAQLSAKSEDSANNVKSETHEFLSKIKKSAKDCDILESRLTPTCGSIGREQEDEFGEYRV
jgi:uncharacterized protein YbbK (DUF523 family)